MNRISLLIMMMCITFSVVAQKNAPKWMDKSRKAVITITTYDKDNRKITSGNGFFVSETGEALSAYTLFKGAGRAVVTDTEGKEYPVTTIIGADELYDVIKFKVAVPRKVPYLSIAREPLAEGTNVYRLGYSTGKDIEFTEGQIVEVSKLADNYSYYKLNFSLQPEQANTPLVSASGEVFGLAQEDASGKNENSYAVSAGYTNTLNLSSVDVFNTIYQNIGIRKAWPSDPEQASVSMFLMQSQQDAATYTETLTDFINTFPNYVDGYVSRASHYAYRRADLATDPAGQNNYLDLALADFNTAAKIAKDKSEVYYNKAKLIYGIALDESVTDNPQWTMDAAIEVLQQAIKTSDQPVYHQLEGDIYLSTGEYAKAYDAYMIVNNSDIASPATFYWAAKALESQPGANIGEIIELLNGAIERSGTPLPAEAGPYLLERVDKRLMLNQYDEAIADYDLYYDLQNGQVADAFYFYREQAKFRKGDLSGALEDIQQAISLDPENPDYYAEEASVYTRMQEYDKALESIQKALDLAPDFGACYRLKGVCLIRQEKKDEACGALGKAKELGDPLVDKLMKEHCE